jgi:predicted metal-dependent hydrolase
MNVASLSYSLVKSSRKSISIIVHPDGRVVVKAPKRATNGQIHEVLKNRMGWIEKHRKRFEEQRLKNPERKFLSGERHLFLGEEFILRIRKADVNRVMLNCEYIDVECVDESIVEELMRQWHLSSFRSIYNVAPARITVKHMRSRWGSCSSRKAVSLNSKLIMTPERCIEYVMVHELCHLIHFNHSENFYSLLTEILPDWKERKKELRSFSLYGY